MPRRAVLSEAQREALLSLPTSEVELVREWTLSPKDLDIIRRRRRPHNRLGFALQLCALRYPGRLLRPGELIAEAPLAFVAEQLGVDPSTLAGYAVRDATRYHQLTALRDAFGFRDLSLPIRAELQAWLLPVALATTSGADVARLLVDELRRRRVVIPGASVVERMAATAMLQAERHVAEQLTRGLDVAQRTGLDGLLELRPGTRLSQLAWVRQPAGVLGHRAFAGLIERLKHLRSLDLDPRTAESVHPERLGRLAQEGARLTAQHLGILRPGRRRAVLVATALEAQVALTDEAVSMFDRLLGKLFRRAETREDTALKRDRRNINDKVRLLAKLGEALITARERGEDAFAAVAAVVPWETLASEVEEARRLVRPDTLDPVALAQAGYPVLRRVAPLFVSSFTFRGAPASSALLRALEIVRELHEGRRRKLPDSPPIGFIRKGWRRQLVRDGQLDRRAYELCVFVELRDRLRAGDVWVEGSRAYRSVEAQLIPRPVFDAMRSAGPLPVAAPLDGRAWLQERRALMAARLAQVGRKADEDRLEDVRLGSGALRISPLRAVTPEEAEALVTRLYGLLPSIRVTELLSEVDRWTGFSRAFTHLQRGRTLDDPRIVLTGILADATNIGHSRMADACSLVTQRQLSWVASWHIREETYGQALALLVDAQHRLPLAAAFGSGYASSSDGQNFALDRRARGTGDVNPHKGSEPAVSFYTHVSNRYAPFHTKVISATAGEAAHVLDGLLHHGADLDIREHHTDGGGVSDHVFALCFLLGFRFAPRIPNIGGRRLHLFDGLEPGPALDPLVAGRIDAKLILAHWDDILRLATSIRTGAVAASAMLRRLGAYPRQNGLALALREIGRVERTLFTLDWIEDPEQRRRATRELNKGEAENALKRAIFFHRIGRVRDRGPEQQGHRASGLNLVAAAIVLWNTTYLQLALDALAQRGQAPAPELLPHLSPLGWQHINLTGDYLWAATTAEAIGPRPLRLGTA